MTTGVPAALLPNLRAIHTAAPNFCSLVVPGHDHCVLTTPAYDHQTVDAQVCAAGSRPRGRTHGLRPWPSAPPRPRAAAWRAASSGPTPHEVARLQEAHATRRGRQGTVHVRPPPVRPPASYKRQLTALRSMRHGRVGDANANRRDLRRSSMARHPNWRQMAATKSLVCRISFGTPTPPWSPKPAGNWPIPNEPPRMAPR
jgi:hypothetical protein